MNISLVRNFSNDGGDSATMLKWKVGAPQEAQSVSHCGSFGARRVAQVLLASI